MTMQELVDQEGFGKRLESLKYWRLWSLEKNYLAYPLAYLFLRELPIKNFYARSIIMFAFYMKYHDCWGSLIPYVQKNGPKMMDDGLLGLHVKNYINIKRNMEEYIIPDGTNKVSDARRWEAIQPGFLDIDQVVNLNTIGNVFAKKRDHFWDGTMNQPTLPLADPYHKDAKTVWLR